MMSLIQKVKALPETVSSNELAAHFQEALAQLSMDSIKSKELFAEIVFELSDKQWHNYEQMDSSLKHNIEEEIMAILHGQLSLALVSSLSGIIGRLGLQRPYQKYKALSLDQSLPTDIRQEMNDTINEFGESVDNPY